MKQTRNVNFLTLTFNIWPLKPKLSSGLEFMERTQNVDFNIWLLGVIFSLGLQP